jgi:hypothetical protein
MTYVYDIDVDVICCLFVCADVATRGREVELQRAPTRQEPVRLPWGGPRVGEIWQRDDATMRLDDLERAERRHWFDDSGAGPSHAPSVDAGVDFEDICHCLEVVLQGIPKGMWSRI